MGNGLFLLFNDLKNSLQGIYKKLLKHQFVYGTSLVVKEFFKL